MQPQQRKNLSKRHPKKPISSLVSAIVPTIQGNKTVPLTVNAGDSFIHRQFIVESLTPKEIHEYNFIQLNSSDGDLYRILTLESYKTAEKENTLRIVGSTPLASKRHLQTRYLIKLTPVKGKTKNFYVIELSEHFSFLQKNEAHFIF